MESRLDELLNSVKSNSSTGYPVVLTHNNDKKFIIKCTSLSKFWNGYCEIIQDFPDEPPGIAEIPKEVGPLVIEGTVRYDENFEGEDIIPEEFMLSIVKAYWSVLLDKFKISKRRPEELHCAYFLSAKFPDSEAQRFRLQFPLIQTDPNYHANIIRNEVVKLLKAEGAKSLLEAEPESDWNEILDSSSITSPILLYGSTRLGVPKLDFQCLYIYDKKNLDSPEKEFEPYEFFNPLNHGHVSSNEVSPEVIASQDGDFWTPLIFSLKYSGKITRFKDDAEEDLEEVQFRNNKNDEDQVVMAQNLLQMINPKRIAKRIFWMEIGRVLYRITDGEKKGLTLWRDISEKAKLDPETCDKQYPEFESENIKVTVKTLAFYARLDNPDRYRTWHENWCFPLMEKCAKNPSDNNVARAFYRNYWLDFLCFGESKKSWYKFHGHIWEHTEDAIEVSKTLSDEFERKFDTFIEQLSKKKLETQDKDDRRGISKDIIEINKFTNKLGNNNFKNKLIKECAVRFHCKEFNKYRDLNYMILPFKNCVIEIDDENKLAVIREGKPEDYMTRNTGMSYPKTLTANSPQVQKYRTWMRQLFPNEGLRIEFEKWLSSLLRGKNLDKKMPVLTGVTNGGKSTLVNCICNCLGEYAIKFGLDIVGKESHSGAPNPGLARAKWARICFLEEIDKSVVIPASFIKKYTGNDKFYARALHDNGGDIDPGFKIAMVLNKMPPIKDSDAAARDRLLPFPFKSIWSHNAPGDENEQMRKRIFKRDDLFSEKLHQMSMAMIWNMVQNYHRYASERFKDNDEIKEYSRDYWAEQDIYQAFIEGHFVETADKKTQVSCDKAYDMFKDWARRKYNRNIDYNEFSAEMKERLGALNSKKRWAGWFLKEDDDDDSEDEIEETEKPKKKSPKKKSPKKHKHQKDDDSDDALEDSSPRKRKNK